MVVYMEAPSLNRIWMYVGVFDVLADAHTRLLAVEDGLRLARQRVKHAHTTEVIVLVRHFAAVPDANPAG